MINSNEYDGNFIEEVAPTYRGKRKDRMVKLRCVVCSDEFIVGYANSKRIRQLACSNQCGGVLSRKTEGGNVSNPNYSRWQSMKDRCNNPNNVRYLRYGARGITYTKEFEQFAAYEEYIQSLPKGKGQTSLDRIDNDMGYIKGNLRWASKHTQAANKTSKRINTSSSYVGVYYCTTHSTWITKLRHQGKTLLCKYFPTPLDAVKARNAFIKEHNLPHPIQSII